MSCPLDLSVPLTQRVVDAHWDPTLKNLVSAAIAQLLVTQPDGSGSKLDRATEQLRQMGIKPAAGALSGKRSQIEALWDEHAPKVKGAKVQRTSTTAVVRFKGDPYRYQKEARQYYSDPSQAFATELLQNSLDALNTSGTGHKWTIKCTVRDVELVVPSNRKQRRVQVVFEDVGIGMDKEVIEEGLLKIGASAESRRDAGRKKDLCNAAGGFGLAKTLLFLGQTSFKIWTKMPGKSEWHVRAEPFREDQEECHIECTADSGAARPVLQSQSHGTRIEILLDPWVMETKESILFEVGDEFYKYREQNASLFCSAADLAEKFRKVWSLSNLPVSLSLNGRDVHLAADLGEFQADIKANIGGSCRSFAALYSKEDTTSATKACQKLRVLLQTERGVRMPGGNQAAGHFLYLCDIVSFRCRTIILQRAMELSVVLFSSDESGTPFRCTDLLKGTRDDLTEMAQNAVQEVVQKFIVDRYAVRPPKPRTSFYKSAGDQAFSKWLDNLKDGNNRFQPRSFETAGKADAHRYFNNKQWRDTIDYNYVLFVDPSETHVPEQYRDVKNMRSHTMLCMELFGVLVREVIDVFAAEVSRKDKEATFDIGVYLGPRDFVRPILPGTPGASAKRPTFLLSPRYISHLLNTDDLPEDATLEEVVKMMTCMKTLALRELIFYLHGIQEGGEAFEVFQDYIMRLEEATHFRQWSWFKVYKRLQECRLMREIQDDREDDSLRRLRRHVVAMQAPCTDDKVSRDVLRIERETLKGRVEELEERVQQMAVHDETQHINPFDERDVMPNPASRLRRMDPAEIRFSQDSCRSTFRCGRSLHDTAQQLRNQEISADINIPIIEVFKWKGEWFTGGNRRLWAYKNAGLKAVPVHIIDFNDVWKDRLTTRDNGATIKVRPGRAADSTPYGRRWRASSRALAAAFSIHIDDVGTALSSERTNLCA
eukprot:TRINITY_DN80459_c0_g1_i1.p1 TRINITY_DN80459_c0_g1~~TRINITY_DN80459_c0_g1_i1.p1  ORF type:complete len:959 (+),score=145.98 TRINITY_DN80459_c0_g1_i1:61-2877(+)